MSERRLYSATALAGREHVVLGNDAARHAGRVLRLRAGDTLVLFDGNGGEYDAGIARLGTREIAVDIVGHRAVERESPLAVTLGQGLARGERMDTIVQKSTELGVASIVPLETARSQVRLDAERRRRRLRHWQRIAIEACRQCGRNRVPAIEAPTAYRDFVARAFGKAARLVLEPGASCGRGYECATSGRSVLLVGPEGGFAKQPNSIRHAADAGFVPLALGPRIAAYRDCGAGGRLQRCNFSYGDFSVPEP